MPLFRVRLLASKWPPGLLFSMESLRTGRGKRPATGLARRSVGIGRAASATTALGCCVGLVGSDHEDQPNPVLRPPTSRTLRDSVTHRGPYLGAKVAGNRIRQGPLHVSIDTPLRSAVHATCVMPSAPPRAHHGMQVMGRPPPTGSSSPTDRWTALSDVTLQAPAAGVLVGIHR
jgi:hypothetical protein